MNHKHINVTYSEYPMAWSGWTNMLDKWKSNIFVQQGAFDWLVEISEKTYIVLNNLKSFLAPHDSSQALLAFGFFNHDQNHLDISKGNKTNITQDMLGFIQLLNKM